MTTRDGRPRLGDGARTTRAADGDRFGWERLSAADESNFLFEHRRQVYVVGIVAVLDAAPLTDGRGEPDLARLHGVLADRVSSIPRLNQRVHFTRPGQGRPVWVDCPADLSVHVRRGPRLDGEDDLAALGARLLGEPLARERPLWDLLVCAGPTAGELTVVLRLHHALADGVSGVRIMGALFDAGTAVPLAAGASRTAVRYPVRAPTGWELVRESWRARWFRVVDVARHPRRWPVRWQAVVGGVRRTSTIARGDGADVAARSVRRAAQRATARGGPEPAARVRTRPRRHGERRPARRGRRGRQRPPRRAGRTGAGAPAGVGSGLAAWR